MIPALITAAAGLAGAGLGYALNRQTNVQNERLNERQLQVAQDMQQRNFDYQREMFDAENAYNTPVAQASRLRAAGINPQMALGNGNSAPVAASAGSGDSGSVPSPISMQAYQPDFSAVGQAVSQYFQNRLQSEQAANISADTDYKMASLHSRVLREFYDVLNSDMDERMKRTLVNRYQRELDFFNDTYQSKKHQVNQESNIAFEQAQKLERENFMDTISMNLEYARRELGVRLSRAQISELYARVQNLYEKTQTERVNRFYLGKQIRKIVQDINNGQPNEYLSNVLYSAFKRNKGFTTLAATHKYQDEYGFKVSDFLGSYSK